jgi:photosystem II stability/assembly factor-like uncharacterized protein
VRVRLLLAALLLAGLPPWALAQASGDAGVSSLTLFAGAPSGLWRSRDWGTSWERVIGRGAGASLDRIGPVRCIAPLGPQVYVAAEGGVFLSPDFGETWQRVADGVACNGLLTSRYPQADSTVFVASPTGLLRSRLDLLQRPEDARRAFTPTALRDTPVFRVEWPGPALVAATGRGVVVSNDGGESFAAAGAGLPPGDVTALAVSTFYAVDPALFVGVAKQGVFRSGDGGRHWVAAGLAERTVNDLVWLGPILYAATDVGLFRTDDLGRSWGELREGIAGRATNRLLFPLVPASGAEAFLATDRGVYWTGDGGINWRQTGNALLNEPILSLATFPPPDTSSLKRRK